MLPRWCDSIILESSRKVEVAYDLRDTSSKGLRVQEQQRWAYAMSWSSRIRLKSPARHDILVAIPVCVTSCPFWRAQDIEKYLGP